jgi:hypothetical protein
MTTETRKTPEVRSMGTKPHWAAQLNTPQSKRQYILTFALVWLIIILTLWILSELVGGAS